MSEARSAPLIPTSFVGRGADLAEIERALGTSRLVTVLGPPGMGKTRLAREYAAASQSRRPAVPVVFCDLTEASSAVAICAALARELGLAFASAEETREAAHMPAIDLVAPMRARGPLLVVLDNFEQLVAHAAETVGAWIGAIPDVRFLVTSRERLGIAGEAIFDLGPLSLEASRGATASEAMALFVERARLVRRDYEPGADDLPIVTELLRELDGLPLAIELCAARMRVMTPAQLLASMPRRFELLSGEARASVDPARARRGAALWNAIESSWAVLPEDDRDALACASVFRGGLSLEALAEVVGRAGDSLSVLDSVQRLVDRSLLRVQDPPGARFSMYVSIREFAAKMLANGEHEAGAMQRHASHYLREGSLWSERVEGARALEARRWLDMELENLLAVHRRSLAQSAGASALEAALVLAPLLALRGPFALGLELLDRALGALPEDTASPLLARGLTAKGQFLQLLGHAREAVAVLESAREVAERVGDRALLARALVELLRALYAGSEWPALQRRGGQALTLCREIGERRLEAKVLACLADGHFSVDEVEAAERAYREALALLRDVGDLASAGAPLGRLGMIALERGEHAEARALLEEALRIHTEHGHLGARYWTIGYLAIVDQDAGQFERVRALFDTALAGVRELGYRRYEALLLVDLGLCLAEQGRTGDARRTLGEALASLERVPRRVASLARACLGALLADADAIEPAEAELAEAAALADGLPQCLRIVDLFRGHLDLGRARVAASSGDALGASEHRAAARRRLEHGPLEEGPPPFDIRFARRSLSRAIAAEPALLEGFGAAEFAADVLVIEPTGAWFRPPRGKRVDLAHRAPLRQLLAELVEQRRAHPGEPVSGDALIRRAWPDAPGRNAATTNRLRVALSSLRKLGLGPLLASRDGGYLLDPSVPLEAPGG